MSTCNPEYSEAYLREQRKVFERGEKKWRARAKTVNVHSQPIRVDVIHESPQSIRLLIGPQSYALDYLEGHYNDPDCDIIKPSRRALPTLPEPSTVSKPELLPSNVISFRLRSSLDPA